MRVAVVSPETIHHRDADDTRRLHRLLRGLSTRGHDVTVCCGRWWGPTPGADASVQGVASPAPYGGSLAEDAPGRADSEERVPADPDERTPADPDDLPPAGNPAAERPVAGEAGDDPDEFATAEDTAGEADAPRTIDVDGVTYRAVVADPSDASGFAARAPLAIRRADPDVIHAVATPPSVVVSARVGATLARAPLLAEWYDPSRADPTAWTTGQALRRPGRILTPSRLTRRQLLELGAQDARLRVVPNPIDVGQIRDTEPGDGGDVVYARRLDEDANLESLLLGLAELRDRSWSATVIGDGPARADYERQVSDLRIEDRVTFAGACDRGDRIAIYRDTHVFVQTARRCVFATELLWALACGCVGIVEYHADSSAHELVEGRERGFRTTDPQETARAIRDAGDLEALTIDESFEAFDESAVLDQYVSQYEELQQEWGVF